MFDLAHDIIIKSVANSMSAVTDMGIGKQSKTLNKNQIEMVSTYLRSKRNGLRNQTIFLLSVKSGSESQGDRFPAVEDGGSA